ncbi:MAG: hypothetical protein A2Y77_13005 [Planctomycetes bacterium RBG_13_62_9]|nr:MAG: hypothetical protein A2Y77_13005 [Planctomycetes bacterium RBG_13_62_9]
MVTHACFMAILIGASIGRATDTQPPGDQGSPSAVNQALADVEQLRLTLSMQETGPGEVQIDVPKLKAGVLEKLNGAGIRHAESEAGQCPRLVVRIEGTVIADCGKYVCRVGTSLGRLVVLPGRPDLQIQAEVWQAKPMTAVVMESGAADTISRAMLAQVEAFTAACEAAREPPDLANHAVQKASAPATPGQAPSSPQNPQTTPAHPFISSKSSLVFHRPDCLWARNIAGSNVIGYKSREEALQAGKRPCKSCQP